MEKHEAAIKQIKLLMVNGFFIAFLVGLIVNQVTELFTYWKIDHEDLQMRSTVVATIVLALLCAGLFFYMFISEIVKFYKDIKNTK